MDVLQQKLVIDWLAALVDPETPFMHKFDSKHSYCVIKYLLDGKMPSTAPSHYEMDKIYRMYELVPEALHPAFDELIAVWKIKLYNDPEKRFDALDEAPFDRRR